MYVLVEWTLNKIVKIVLRDFAAIFSSNYRSRNNEMRVSRARSGHLWYDDRLSRKMMSAIMSDKRMDLLFFRIASENYN